jgi:hypothetical protein
MLIDQCFGKALFEQVASALRGTCVPAELRKHDRCCYVLSGTGRQAQYLSLSFRFIIHICKLFKDAASTLNLSTIR